MARCFALLSGIALVVAVGQTLGSEASKLKYPRPSPGSCVPNGQNFGYFPTQWRQWPCENRPEISNPRSVGATAVPSPQPQPQRELIPTPPARPSSPPGSGLELPPTLQLEAPTERGRDELPGLPRLPPEVAPPPAPNEPDVEKNSPAPKASGAEQPQQKAKDAAQPQPDDITIPGISFDDGRGTGVIKAFGQPTVKRTAAVSIPDPTPHGLGTGRASGAHGTGKAGGTTEQHRADAIADTISVGPENEIEPAAFATADDAPKAAVGEAFAEASDEPAAAPAVALLGYCPVELVRSGRWVPGRQQWTVVRDGRIYRFSGATQHGEFLAHPEAFVPAHDGNDPVLTIDQHRAVTGKPAFCATYGGRLYMFSSATTQAQFNQTPERYAEK